MQEGVWKTHILRKDLLVLKMSRVSDKEKVFSAVEAVISLNKEAGVSNVTLNALLEIVSEEKGKAAFDKFCNDIMACIHECFSHFRAVMPLLAKVRAHKDFH